MTDEATLTALRHRLAEVRDSMRDVHMTIPDNAIFTDARKRRTRRGIAVALTAVCAAIGIAVALVLPGGQAPAGHVHLAAWSVEANSDGTVTVTIRQMLGNPVGLQQALAKDGVAAVVRYIPYKTSTRRHHGHTDFATYPACEYQGGLPKEPDSVTAKARGLGGLHRNRIRLDGHAPHQFPVAPVRARRTATWLVTPANRSGRMVISGLNGGCRPGLPRGTQLAARIVGTGWRGE